MPRSHCKKKASFAKRRIPAKQFIYMTLHDIAIVSFRHRQAAPTRLELPDHHNGTATQAVDRVGPREGSTNTGVKPPSRRFRKIATHY